MAQTFVHMLIGLAGASMAAYGAQKLTQTQCDNKYVVKTKLNACVKAAKDAKSKAACQTQYTPKNDLMWKILQYGGCGLIVLLFLALTVFANGISIGGGGGMGMGMGGGGMGYQQQWS